ncbi:MAG: NifB/NifX family molybdenum-iron cluster-binding protein, partial [Actinomycetes bacterium]
MIVCVPIGPGGLVDPAWGRADQVGIAVVEAGHITDWRTVDVGWGAQRAEGREGAHHARIARFLRDNQVEV